MGQYYKPISIDAKQYLYSHSYDNGLKLMEHSYVGNNFMQAALNMLAEGGAWYKTRIVWAGDYMDDGLFMPKNSKEGNLYGLASESFLEIKPSDEKRGQKYIINHSKNEYCKIPKYSKDEWQPHPLSLLTCSGNGRGGGDYRKSNEYTGAWAGDIISASTVNPPKTFKEIIPNFEMD